MFSLDKSKSHQRLFNTSSQSQSYVVTTHPRIAEVIKVDVKKSLNSIILHDSGIAKTHRSRENNKVPPIFHQNPKSAYTSKVTIKLATDP